MKERIAVVKVCDSVANLSSGSSLSDRKVDVLTYIAKVTDLLRNF